MVYVAVDTWAATESLIQGLERLGFPKKKWKTGRFPEVGPLLYSSINNPYKWPKING